MDIKYISSVIFIWIAALDIIPVYCQTCENGRVINGICYTIVRERKNHNDAKDYCKDYGGKLASITDQSTQDAIDQLAQDNLFPIPELWIGATESVNTFNDRKWRWIHDETSTVLNQGCYKDSANSRDLKPLETQKTFSVDDCIDGCKDSGNRYAGLQNGDQCFCGNDFGQFGSGSGCSTPCPSPLDRFSVPYCGGEYSNIIIDSKGTYLRWAFDQPNNHNNYQMCGALDMNVDTKAVDELCSKYYRYICDVPGKSPDTCSGGETGSVNGIYYLGKDTNKCYFVSRDAGYNWYVAKQNCLQINGNLTVVNTRDIHNDLIYIINNVITTEDLKTSTILWIGLYRGSWKWETGEKFLYTNWAMESPSSWQANCVMMLRSSAFKWVDRDCQTNAYFLCQEGDIPVPSTTTTASTVATTTTNGGEITTTTSNSQTPSAGQQTGDSGLSTDEIILLVIILVLFVVAVVIFSIIIYFCCKRKSRRITSEKRTITGPLSTRSTGSIYSSEFIDINDQTDFYNGSAVSYRY